MDANTNNAVGNTVIPVQSQIPTFAEIGVSTLAPFDAFKLEEKFSFVRPYSPSLCNELAGYRHSVIRYRNTDKTGTVSKPAKMVTIPQLALPDDWQVAMDERAQKVILGVLEDEQDNIIRNLIDEKQASRVSWDDLVLDKVLDSLTAVRISQRLTKEQIEAWGRVAMNEVCTTRAKQIAEAKGFNPEQTAKQIAGTLNAYVALAMKLAAPVPNIGQNEATALQNLLLVGQLDDDMAKVLKAKLHAILNPKVAENNDL